MAFINVKIEINRSRRRWVSLPKLDKRIPGIAVLISILFHIVSWWNTARLPIAKSSRHYESVKYRTMTKDEKKLIDEKKTMLETKLAETEAPKTPARMGAQDHATQKETRIANQLLRNPQALDPGAAQIPTLQNQPQTKTLNQSEARQSLANERAVTKVENSGTMSINSRDKRPTTPYEKLFPDKSREVIAQTPGGYTEIVDPDIPEGDRIDMNTTNFKYIAYFTGFRRQIDMVWIYPSEAIQRGLQGNVELEITLEKDGKVSKVRMLNSSGYALLDENMLKTIKLASPFPPLPAKWKREKIIIIGNFQHILSYASH